MEAHGADLGGLLTDLHMTAVAAEPHDLIALLEDLALLQVVQQLQIALFVGLLDLGNAFELSGQSQEALFLGDKENTAFWEMFGLDEDTKMPTSGSVPTK